MLGRTILNWMVENRQSAQELSLRANLHADRLFALITGDAMPWGPPELEALAGAMGISPEDLRGGQESGGETSSEYDYPCYFTVSEVAALVGVSEEIVRKEVEAGELASTSSDEHLVLIPRAALVERLSWWNNL